MTSTKKAAAKNDFDIVVINFADSRIPEFKEVNNKPWIPCGITNDYPEYLIYQYNKCGKHRAIVNGKSKYIYGGGLEGIGGLATTTTNNIVIPAQFINGDKETMGDILKKSIKDIEIHGGFRWLITWNQLNQVAEIYHEDFYKFRTAKNICTYDANGKKLTSESGGFYYKEKWINENGTENRKEKEIHYSEYNGTAPNINDACKIQVFAYNEYGPATDMYPLPEYVGCANWIDIDIEIGKFHLSSLRNGMMPSKMIQFYTGEPTEEKKKEIEKRFAKKFAGSENAGKFVLVFNSNKDKQVDISDLSFNELDKQFEVLNKTTQQEIFTGHQVTSPMLFGVKTEGQLGGHSELRTAYEIFINTYAKPKQEDVLKIVNYFGAKLGKGSNYTFIQLDTIGIQFDSNSVVNLLPKEFIYQIVGVPKTMWASSPALPAGALPVNTLPAGSTPVITAEAQATNDNIKNLTAKQHQQLLRIIRQFGKGQLTEAAATALLKTGLGLSDTDINAMLGIGMETETEVATSMQMFVDDIMTEDTVIGLFAAVGLPRNEFDIIKSKRIIFAADANIYFSAGNVQADILGLIKKDANITPEVIAKALDLKPNYVTEQIKILVNDGWLGTKEIKVGTDTQTKRTLLKPISELPNAPATPKTEISIKYSYEGPRDKRNRPFCAKLLELDRLYTRKEIENISLQLGYSVFERRGGWWTKPSGVHSPSCRHQWESHIVIKKN